MRVATLALSSTLINFELVQISMRVDVIESWREFLLVSPVTSSQHSNQVSIGTQVLFLSPVTLVSSVYCRCMRNDCVVTND
jgi:hypothetical protein